MTENKDLTMLKQFINPISYKSKFHEAIIAFLSVNFISVDEENNLRALFRYMDKDGKNAITKEQMKECLEEININISDEQLDEVFESVDDNGTGYIEYQEFIRNACNIKNLLSESNLKNVFHTISGNKEKISGEDIKNFIFHDSEIQEVTLKEYFEEFGMKYDDTIIFDEFYAMIKKNKKLRNREPRKKRKYNSSKFVYRGPIISEEKIEEEEENNNEIKSYNNEKSEKSEDCKDKKKKDDAKEENKINEENIENEKNN